MEKILLTPAGLQKMQSQLHHLKNVLKPGVINDISTARDLGDLSENAEYHEAKRQQGFIESKITELESIISSAHVVDPASIQSDHVMFGATVTLEDQNNNDVCVYKIVGQVEADIEKNLISMYSPLGMALMNKRENDYVDVITPGGERLYQLLKIEFK